MMYLRKWIIFKSLSWAKIWHSYVANYKYVGDLICILYITKIKFMHNRDAKLIALFLIFLVIIIAEFKLIGKL